MCLRKRKEQKSERDKGRETGRERGAVCAACLAAEATNPLSRTPIRNTLSAKARISNTQAAGFYIS